MDYKPEPVNTQDIVLPEELLALTEKIAENVHDVWAVGRMAEGWTFGEKKDADSKTTPLLVPYSVLPESEKAYDRNTVLETVKLIVKLGYNIEKRIPAHIERMMRVLYGIYNGSKSSEDNFFSFDYMANGFFDVEQLESNLDTAIELGLIQSYHKPRYDIMSVVITDYGMSYCKKISEN